MSEPSDEDEIAWSTDEPERVSKGLSSGDDEEYLTPSLAGFLEL